MALSMSAAAVAPVAGLRSAPLARRAAVRMAPVRAAKGPDSKATSSMDADKLVQDAAAAWDKVEDKTSVVVYGVGAVAILWISSAVVGAVNGIPLVPKFLELVGLGYTGWFTYRYLLFKSSRQELLADIEDLKKKIAGQ